MSKYTELYKKLGIDNTFFTIPKKEKKFDTIKQNVFPQEDFNFMADIVILPKAKFGFQYLLVVVDLWSKDLDFEEMKNKDAKSCLYAFQKILGRPYLNLPKASVITDEGGEFKSVFKKYLFDNNISHRVKAVGRHKQLSLVNSMCALISNFIMKYLNMKEIQTKKTQKNWIDILPLLRVELNNSIKKVPNEDPYDISKPIAYTQNIEKYKVGDKVYRVLDSPKDIVSDKKYSIHAFRKGDLRWDMTPRKILKIFNYPNNNRYYLEGIANISFTENELMKV